LTHLYVPAETSLPTGAGFATIITLPIFSPSDPTDELLLDVMDAAWLRDEELSRT
jgi:hypothetical protein